jgi:hypothetical protein
LYNRLSDKILMLCKYSTLRDEKKYFAKNSRLTMFIGLVFALTA